MGNKLLGKGRKSLFTLALVALLTALMGTSAYAADVGAASNASTLIVASDTAINFDQAGTLTMDVTKTTTGALTTADTITGIIATASGGSDYNLTVGSTDLDVTSGAGGLDITGGGNVVLGAVAFSGSSAPAVIDQQGTGIISLSGGSATLLDLTATAAGTFAATDNLLVRTINVNANTTLNVADAGHTVTVTAAGAGTVLAANAELTITGAGAVDLDTVVASAGTGSKLILDGTGVVTLDGGDVANLTVQVTEDGAQLTTDEATTMLALDIDNSFTLTTAGGGFNVGTDDTTIDTTIADGATVTLAPGAVGLALNDVEASGTSGISVTTDNADQINMDLTLAEDAVFSVKSTDGTHDLNLGAVTMGGNASLFVLDSGADDSVVSAESVALGTNTLTVKNLDTDADDTLALGNVTAGAGAGLTVDSNNAGAIVATSVTLGAGELTVTMDDTGSLALGTIAVDASGSSKLSIAGGDVAATSITVDNSAEIGVASGKTLTLAGATSDVTAAKTITVSGAGTVDFDTNGIKLDGTDATTNVATLAISDTATVNGKINIANNAFGAITVASDATLNADGDTVLTGDGQLAVTNNNTTTAATLGTVTAGISSGITAKGAGTVSATGVTLAGGTFTATNAGTGSLALGAVDLAAASADLATATGAVSATSVTVTDNSSITTGAGAAFETTTTEYGADTKTLTVDATNADVSLGTLTARAGAASALTVTDGNVSITETKINTDNFTVTETAGALSLGAVTTTGAGTLTTAGSRAIDATSLAVTEDTAITTGANAALTFSSSTSVDADTLTVTANGTSADVALGAVTLTNGGTVANIGAGKTTATSLNVAAGDTGTVGQNTGAGTVDVTTTTVSGTLTVTDTAGGGTLSDVNLGALTLTGAELVLTTAATEIDLTSLSNSSTSIVSVTGGAGAGKIIIGDDVITFASGSTLIYDGAKVKLYQSDGTSEITSATYSNLIDTNDTQVVTASITTNESVAALDITTLGSDVTISSDATVVNNGAITTAADEKLTISSGSTLVQMGATTEGAAQGAVDLGGTYQATTAGALTTLNTVGTTGTIKGSTVTVTNLNVESNEALTVEGNLTLKNAAATVSAGSGTLTLAGITQDTTGILDINGNAETIGTLNVTSGKYGVINDTADGGALTVNGGTIAGHLLLGTNADLIVAGGALAISANTLNMSNGSSITIESDGSLTTTGVGGTNDGHIKVNGDGGGVTATITNKSELTTNTIGWLDVDGGDAGGADVAALTINDTGAANMSYLKITKADITTSTAGDTATVTIDGTVKKQDVQITELNLTGVNAAATLVSQNGADTDITTVNLYGVTAGNNVINNKVAGTAGTESTIMNIGTINADATASATAMRGTLDNSGANDAITEVSTINLSGDTTANSATQLIVDNTGTGSHTVSIGTVNLGGVNAAGDAELVLQQSAGTLTASIDTINVAASKKGTITNTSGTLTFKDAAIYGDLTMANAFTVGDGTSGKFTVGNGGTLTSGGAITTAAGGEIYITAGGTVTTTAGGINTNTGKLTLDLGTSAGTAGVENDATKYATVTAAAAYTTAKSGTNYDEVFAVNGISGTTYDDVFITTDLIGATAGDTLSTTDRYRTYVLGADVSDIVVGTNTSGINSAVTGNGGTAVASTAAQYLVENQASFDSEGFTYVQNMAQLSAPQFARAAEETIGEEATTQTAQNALMGVNASTTAVSNQMTSFRSGNIAAGMASSFNSGGATAALSDMADAETLAEAYEAGFTSGSDCAVYKKVQVWANGFGGFGEQGTDGTMIGYDFWNIGTMVGLDYAFAKELRVGALFGYSYNKTDVNWNSGDSTDNLLRFGAYASYNWDNFFVDLSPTMGIHILESNRNIWNGATAKGDRTGVDFNISGTVGYTFNLPADIQLTPSYSLGYTMFYDPEFTETGAGAANVKYNSFTSNSLLQDLGVRLGKLIRTSDDLAFLPEVWGGWEVEYLNTGGNRNTTTASSIGSQTYGTTMNGMATNRGYWGAGMTALIKDNVSVFGRYDQKIWDKGYNVGFTAGVKVSF